MHNPIAVCVDRNPFDDVEALVSTINAAGFDRVEWFEVDEKEIWSDSALAPQLRALIRRYEISPQYHAPYAAPFDLACDNGALRPPHAIAAMIGTCLDRAERLGANMMTLHFGSCPPEADRAQALENVLEGVVLALPQLERRRIRLALENHTQAIIKSSIGDRPEDLDWLMQHVQSEWVGMTLDIGHAHINNHLREFLSRPFDRVFNIHLHDNDGTQDEHLPLGAGTIPWPEVLHRIASECYRGPLTFEFFTSVQTYQDNIRMVRAAE